jgi:glycosyltransferase involved in cell wall biosynthesis
VKIAYLINQYPQASQSFIRREINALESLGVHVDRFTLRTWDQEVVDPGDKEEKAKTRVVLAVGALGLLRATLASLFTNPSAFLQTLRLAWKMGKRGDRGRLYHLIYLGEACVLVRWLRECGSEHLHAHFGTNSTTVAMLARTLGGPPYSFTCHGPEEFDRPGALKLGEKVARAKFVVAVSEYGRSQLFRWADYPHWHKIHVVHCGVDASFLTDEAPPLPDNVHQLVCVGRLAEQKGQLILIQAAARLRAGNIPFRLVLVGDGPMRKEIELLIQRNKLESHVSITGWMSNREVREQILASRAMILPSFAEGLPVVIMETLALQRPVVSTYVAGIPELVEAGNCGYLVPAGSVNDLAHVLRQVLNESPENLRKMGFEGRGRVRERHDAGTEATKLLNLFRAIAEEQNSALDVPDDYVSQLSRSESGVGPTG